MVLETSLSALSFSESVFNANIKFLDAALAGEAGVNLGGLNIRAPDCLAVVDVVVVALDNNEGLLNRSFKVESCCGFDWNGEDSPEGLGLKLNRFVDGDPNTVLVVVATPKDGLLPNSGVPAKAGDVPNVEEVLKAVVAPKVGVAPKEGFVPPNAGDEPKAGDAPKGCVRLGAGDELKTWEDVVIDV